MMKIKHSNNDLTLVLEPANIRLMKEGKPVAVDLSTVGGSGKLLIYFTPDVPRLQLEFGIESEKKIVITAEEIDKIIRSSVEWREFDRATM